MFVYELSDCVFKFSCSQMITESHMWNGHEQRFNLIGPIYSLEIFRKTGLTFSWWDFLKPFTGDFAFKFNLMKLLYKVPEMVGLEC